MSRLNHNHAIYAVLGGWLAFTSVVLAAPAPTVVDVLASDIEAGICEFPTPADGGILTKCGPQHIYFEIKDLSRSTKHAHVLDVLKDLP